RAALRVACLSESCASSCDAERRDLHSHAGACGTITRLPYCALRRHAFPGVRNDHRNYRATRSVENCIPTLERRERSSQLPYGALRRHIDPDVRNDHRNYRATQSVENCITTLERAER
ncbi:Uncharacterized protein ALO71_03506, partial [Pseudomonas amygdali pv. dendropanacis]